MTPREKGFLLLCSELGDPCRKPLTVAQLRTLAQRAAQMERPGENRDMVAEDLIKLGYDRSNAQRIVLLLSQTPQLNRYVKRAQQCGCIPVTRTSEPYPDRLRKKLQLDAPGCLWAKGDVSLLKRKSISLVGSRDLHEENRQFAREAGKQAALQGYVLVSGNARGADRTAQEACLANGGSVICVVADRLADHALQENILYLSERDFDQPFSAERALSRNRIIHALSEKTLVAQCTFGKGGTWSGTLCNLRKNLSQVFCFNDGSNALQELCCMGAEPISADQLSNLEALLWSVVGFVDP